MTPADRSDGWRREYVLRETDRHVHAITGLRPLSVAADCIGHVAIRLAALISELDPGVDSSLDGSSAMWLDLGAHATVVRTSDHALDAVLCALLGEPEPSPPGQGSIAVGDPQHGSRQRGHGRTLRRGTARGEPSYDRSA